MKNMYILSSITIFAFVGILVCSVSYTSDTPPMDTSQQSANTVKPKQALKKKSCPCCDEKQKRTRKMMREWIHEKPQVNPSNKEFSATDAETDRAQFVR